MLQESLREDLWDVVMVGFNLLNPSARRTVFPLTAAKKVGVLDMFAVRRALSQSASFKKPVRRIDSKGSDFRVARSIADDPLGFLLEEGVAATIPEAAYRFCRHEPAVDVVLTGTGNPEHLKANIEAILKPPLPHRHSNDWRNSSVS